MQSSSLYATPLFGVAATVVAYVAAQWVHRRWPVVHPLLVTCGALIAFLLLNRVPYEQYKIGGDMVSFFLGPATVALGVPLYKHATRIRRHLGAVILSVTIGSACGLASAAGFVWALGGSGILLRSMLPKSVTTPIAIELSRQLGGTPELSAVFAVLAGLAGSVIGPALLRRLGVRSDLAIGLAMGTSSHGIGTARVVRDSELQAGASGLAMALAGIITSLMVVPLHAWLR